MCLRLKHFLFAFMPLVSGSGIAAGQGAGSPLFFRQNRKRCCVCGTRFLLGLQLRQILPELRRSLEAQMDEALKSQAEKVLFNEGLTISDFVCSVLSMLVKERKLPFDAKVPNKLPAQTLVKSARNKGLHQTKDVEDLFKKIGNLIRQDAP